MPFYQDAGLFCAVMDELFRRTMDSPSAVETLRHTPLVVRLRTTDPEAVLTVNSRVEPPTFSCGQDQAQPDLTLTMAADVLHQVWLGKLGLRDAFFKGQMRVDGPLMRALGLAGLFREVEALYPRVLAEHGLLPNG